MKWSYLLDKKFEKTLWTVIICSLTFFMLEITRKFRPKTFLHWKGCPFFKTLCFQQFLTSQKNAVLFSSVNVTKACGPFQSFPWLLSHSVIREKWAKSFVIVRTAFFEMFVSIELLDPGEMILIFAQYLSKCLVDTCRLFHDTFHVQ